MEHFDAIVTDPAITRRAVADFLSRSRDPFELFSGKYYVVHTSGSSGEVGYFLYSLADWSRGAAQALRGNLPSLGKRRLAFFGAENGHFTGATFAASTRRSLPRLFYDVAILDIKTPLRAVPERLNAFQPTILMGYASSIAILADRQLAGTLQKRTCRT